MNDAVMTRPDNVVRPLFWSVRRELWENRSLWIGPIIAACVSLLGFMASMVFFVLSTRQSENDPVHLQMELTQPYTGVVTLILATGFIVSINYCLDALYSDRRNRSVLFWKSLPVSDTTTVLSKMLVPMLVQPVIELVVIVVLQLAMLVFSSVLSATHGSSPAATWREFSIGEGALALVYQLVVGSLWYAPIYAWLLLVSSWARRVPFLWAVLPLAAIAVFERIAFGTFHFALMLKDRLLGVDVAAYLEYSSHQVVPPIEQIAPLRFLGTPGLWGGLVATAVFLAASVWMRRRREAI